MKSSENHGSMKISGRIEVCLILDLHFTTNIKQIMQINFYDL